MVLTEEMSLKMGQTTENIIIINLGKITIKNLNHQVDNYSTLSKLNSLTNTI